MLAKEGITEKLNCSEFDIYTSAASLIKLFMSIYLQKLKCNCKIGVHFSFNFCSYSVSTKMPTFRNQIWVKCEISFADWANQVGSLEVFNPPSGVEGQSCTVSFYCLCTSIILEDLILGTNSQL